MLIRKCDWCGKTEQDTKVRSRLTVRYNCEVNVAEEYERPDFESQQRGKTWDLCDECGAKLYRLIEGHDPPKKIL